MIDNILQTTLDLMKYRSTANRTEELDKCADHIVNFFRGTNLKVQKIVHNNIPSVIVTKHNKSPKVMLCGHFDVVDGTDEQFEPIVKGDKLYGRGSFDMKSGDAVMMHIMRELADTDHDVGLVITGDEEIGGNSGVEYILNKLGYRAKVAVIPDGGTAVHKLITKEKGLLRIILKAEGTAAHSAYLWRGENAINKLRTALDEVEKLFTPVEAHPDDHWVTTFNVGEIVGGQAFNLVPKFAKVHCDIRIVETETGDEIIKKIASVLPEGVTYEVDLVNNASYNRPDHELVEPFVESVRAHGRTPEFLVTHGASDGRFFADLGIPVIMCQPDGGGIHEDGEWVSIKGIEMYYNVLLDYLNKVSVFGIKVAEPVKIKRKE